MEISQLQIIYKFEICKLKEFNVDGRIGKDKSGVLELWTEENAGIPPVLF